MKLLPVILLSATQAHRAAPPTQPPTTQPADPFCPSSACWVSNTADRSCTLRDRQGLIDNSCSVSVACDTSGMTINFAPELFNSNSDTLFEVNGVLHPVGNACLPTNNNGAGSLSGALGSCGMTVDRDATNILFKQTISVGSFHHTGIDVADSDGAAIRIFTEESRGISVEFVCEFPIVASVTSEPMNIIQDGIIDATFTGQGNWDNAFSIGFFDSSYANAIDPRTVTIGDPLYVSVNFAPTGIPLQWFVEDCTVTGPGPNFGTVDIVKDACYADVVNAFFGGNTSGDVSSNKRVQTYSRFQYSSFSFGTSSTESQTLTCTIEFCLTDQNTGDCALSTRQCTTSGVWADLSYTTYGSAPTTSR